MRIRSIKLKLTVFFGILISVVSLGFGIMTYLEASKMQMEYIEDILPQMAEEAAEVVNSRITSQIDKLELLAGDDDIKSEELTTTEKLDILNQEAERSGHLKMGIADTAGNIQYSNGDKSINIADRDYFKKALAGESNVSDPILSKSNNKVVICYAAPIKEGDTIKGVLVATRDGNELSTYINDVHFGKNGSAYMINNECTTIAHKDQNLVIKMDNDLENVKKDPGLESLVKLEKQMMEGKEGTGEYSYNGVTKFMAYTPVKGTSWSLALTAPESEVIAKVNELGSRMIVLSLIFILAGLIITYFLAMQISKPIKAAAEFLNKVSSGDFSNDVPQKLLKSDDEIGILANAIQTMQQSFRKTVKHVIDGSNEVGHILDNINDGMYKLNKSIEGISATTEELSASTEETASSTEEMNATSTEIEDAVGSIASKAQDGAVKVSNVNKMAEEMHKNAETSKGNAKEIYGRTKNELQRAIEQSKAVNQINELSEAILAITSQTNLLALNAAIEAARAGEAGKGFAVVAEEIRKLAEDSRNTVTRIQSVTKIIYEAVNNLSSSSEEVLEFIDKQVAKDYDYMVDTSEQYTEDTSAINDMVTDFSATSEELLASIDNMVKAINEISSASNEEAQGASSIAQDASGIAEMSNDVIKLAESAKEKSDSLIKVVSQFKIKA
ncbi:MAG TPA: methyl-accepting chemotaxis protein [Clostridia bacterium]|nr:methyl-accepting chemotaxis protein [Clostridia bacterium]